MMPVRPTPKPSIEKMENTKQAMTKHFALLASLGRFGLSEHIFSKRERSEH